MAGEERVVGADVAKVCNKNIKDCNQAKEIRNTLPKYQGGESAKSAGFQKQAVAYNANTFELIQH